MNFFLHFTGHSAPWQLILVFAAACFFLFIGVYLLIGNIRFLKKAVKAEGEVVAEKAESGYKGGVIYDPVIRFTARDGRQRTFVSDFGMSAGMPKPGTKVTVLYDPEKPHKAKWDDSIGLWVFPFLFIIAPLGAIVFIAWQWNLG